MESTGWTPQTGGWEAGGEIWNCSRKEGMSHSGEMVWWGRDSDPAGDAPALLPEKQTQVCLACTGLCKLREMILQFVLSGSLSKGNCFSFLKKHTHWVQVLLSYLFIFILQVYCSLFLKETVPYNWRLGMWVFFQERMSWRCIDMQGYSGLPWEGSGYICLRISSPSCPFSYPLEKNKIWTDPCPFAEKVLGLGLPQFSWALWQPCWGLLL